MKLIRLEQWWSVQKAVLSFVSCFLFWSGKILCCICLHSLAGTARSQKRQQAWPAWQHVFCDVPDDRRARLHGKPNLIQWPRNSQLSLILKLRFDFWLNSGSVLYLSRWEFQKIVKILKGHTYWTHSKSCVLNFQSFTNFMQLRVKNRFLYVCILMPSSFLVSVIINTNVVTLSF